MAFPGPISSSGVVFTIVISKMSLWASCRFSNTWLSKWTRCIQGCASWILPAQLCYPNLWRKFRNIPFIWLSSSLITYRLGPLGSTRCQDCNTFQFVRPASCIVFISQLTVLLMILMAMTFGRFWFDWVYIDCGFVWKGALVKKSHIAQYD